MRRTHARRHAWSVQRSIKRVKSDAKRGASCKNSTRVDLTAGTARKLLRLLLLLLLLLCCCSSGWAGLCFGAATSISYIFSRCDCCCLCRCLSRCCCWDFAAISNTNCTVFMATNAFLSFFFRSFVLVVAFAFALAVCTRVSTTSALARHTNGFHFNSFRQR